MATPKRLPFTVIVVNGERRVYFPDGDRIRPFHRYSLAVQASIEPHGMRGYSVPVLFGSMADTLAEFDHVGKPKFDETIG